MDFLPDVEQLSQIMSHATAPAFVLGAVAGFISILMTRMTNIIDRIRSLNGIPADADRASLKSDIPRLKRRANLLNNAMRFALASGICTALLLVIGFVCAFFGMPHIYGVGFLFVVAIALLGISLFRFSQEVGMGLSEFDHHQ